MKAEHQIWSFHAEYDAAKHSIRNSAAPPDIDAVDPAAPPTDVVAGGLPRGNVYFVQKDSLQDVLPCVGGIAGLLMLAENASALLKCGAHDRLLQKCVRVLRAALHGNTANLQEMKQANGYRILRTILLPFCLEVRHRDAAAPQDPNVTKADVKHQQAEGPAAAAVAGGDSDASAGGCGSSLLREVLDEIFLMG